MLHPGSARLPEVLVRLLLIHLNCLVEAKGNEEESEIVRSANGQWQSQVRIESDRNVTANTASNSTLELPVHEINNDTLISSQEGLPKAGTHLPVRSGSIVVRHFHVWLLLNTVEILVDQIQEVVDELARVLLTVSTEPRHSLS